MENMENVSSGFTYTAAGWLMDFIGRKYWINYYPSDDQMAWNFSLGCSQSSWEWCYFLGSFIPRTCGLKNSVKSAFPFQSLIQLFHLFALRGKGEVAQWWRLEISSICLSQIDCSCLLLPVLNFVISDITRCLFKELCLYSEIMF